MIFLAFIVVSQTFQACELKIYNRKIFDVIRVSGQKSKVTLSPMLLVRFFFLDCGLIGGKCLLGCVGFLTAVPSVATGK